MVVGEDKLADYPRGEQISTAEYWAYLSYFDAAQWFIYRFAGAIILAGVWVGFLGNAPLLILGFGLLLGSNLLVALNVRRQFLESFPDQPKIKALIPFALCFVPFGTAVYCDRVKHKISERLKRAGISERVLSQKNRREAVGRRLLNPAGGERDYRVPPVAR